MMRGEIKKLAEELERHMKRYEMLLEKQFNVGEHLSRDEIQWMADFENPERHVQGIYHKLQRVNDPYVDMILNRFDSLKRKKHGLSQVQKIRDVGAYAGAGSGASVQGGAEEFFNASHKDVDTLVNDLVLAIHKKSGGISPSNMERYADQIRKRAEKIWEKDQNKAIKVKAAVNRENNRIEIVVDPSDEN